MRASRLLAVLAALGLLVAACDGQPADTPDATETPAPAEQDADEGAAEEREIADDDEARERIAEAAERTVEEGTARFVMSVAAADAAVDAEAQEGGAAEEDGAEAAGEADADAAGEIDGTLVRAEGEEDFENEQRRIVFDGGDQGDFEVIVDGTDVYFELPATEDDDWARVQLAELTEGDVGFGGPAGLPFQGARDNLEILSSAAVRAAEVGEEDLDGETTDRYELVIDLQAAAAEADDPDMSEALDRAAGQSGVDELHMDVWIDGDDRIRRVSYRLDLSQAGVDAEDTEADVDARAQGELLVTVEYSDFGTDLAIEVPGEDQIVDIDEDELNRLGQQAQQQAEAQDGAGGATGAEDDTGTTS